MAKNNQRDPNLRAATVARVNQLVKGGLSKAAAFDKILSLIHISEPTRPY